MVVRITVTGRIAVTDRIPVTDRIAIPNRIALTGRIARIVLMEKGNFLSSILERVSLIQAFFKNCKPKK